MPIVATILLFVVLAAIPSTLAQDTLQRSGCSFVTGDSVYNVQLSRGINQQACQSSESLNDQLKVTTGRTNEMAYDLVQLQGTVLRLMESNKNLTVMVMELNEQLRVTKQALRLHQAGMITIHNLLLHGISV